MSKLKISFFFFVLFPFFWGGMTQPAAAITEVPNYVKDHLPNAQLVGKGRLIYFIWDVYDARLFAPNGVYENGQPFALKLTYLRDFKGHKIAEKSVEEMADQGFEDEDKLSEWLALMTDLFPDVQENDSLTGVRLADGRSVFYHNAEKLQTVDDTFFTEKFFDIWVSPKTSEPALRQQLVGENPDG